MTIKITDIIQILTDNLKISESGFSGEDSISGVFRSAKVICDLIDKGKYKERCKVCGKEETENIKHLKWQESLEIALETNAKLLVENNRLKGISVESIDLIKELKNMIYLSKSPMMDNSHILDTRKADKILNKLYKLIQGE